GIGGHTATHPILAALEESAARREIVEGRDVLQGIVRQPVRLFAYPNGKPNVDYSAVHVRMIKALGFAAAVSTAPGAARAETSSWGLGRFSEGDGRGGGGGIRLGRNLFKPADTAVA